MMQDIDPYLQAALTRTRQLEQETASFRLAAEQSLSQGKNNRVVRGFYDGMPVIVKYYGDAWKSNIALERRRAKEQFCLEHYASSGVVPRLVSAAFSEVLIMEEIPGHSLQTLL